MNSDQTFNPIDSVGHENPVWKLRDAHHALVWLQTCSAWADAGQSGEPPLIPFRLWGLGESDLTAITEPLALLPHALQLRRADSAHIRTLMETHPAAHLRWALMCLRHHGDAHSAAWATLDTAQQRNSALLHYVQRQWQHAVGAERSPDQGLLDEVLWASLIRMQAERYHQPELPGSHAGQGGHMPGAAFGSSADHVGDRSGERMGAAAGQSASRPVAEELLL